MKNAEFKKAYDELEPVYQTIRELVAYRIKKGLTQKQLAEKIGTRQSSISRLESSGQLPSLSFLKSVADALKSQTASEADPEINRIENLSPHQSNSEFSFCLEDVQKV